MPLVPAYLTPFHCLSLAERMREGDRRECALVGHSPVQALLTGLQAGPAVVVLRDSSLHDWPMGAFGVNLQELAIWSLWADGLTWQEQFQILKATPQAVAGLVALAGDRQLHNLVDIRNKVAIEWLERSGCFHLDDVIEQIGEGSFLRFTTVQGRP